MTTSKAACLPADDATSSRPAALHRQRRRPILITADLGRTVVRKRQLVGADSRLQANASVASVASLLAIRGRMTASYRTISYGAVALGAALGGVVGQLAGLRTGLIVGGLALLATVAWVAFTPLLRLRTIDDAARLPEARDA